nr:MAG TPA: hypothetical protein [Caudoviricetes sp.]
MLESFCLMTKNCLFPTCYLMRTLPPPKFP